MLYFEYYLLGILLLPGVIFAAIAQYRVTSTFNKFKNVASESGKTAYEIARMFLDFAGLQDVQIIKVRGHLTDYYNHRKRTLALSESTYNSSSISALGVACHEVGHALQFKTRYFPIMIRNFLIPIVNFAQHFVWILLIFGFVVFYTTTNTLWLWIALAVFASSTLIHLITLPVEYNASKRALKLLEDSTILTSDETADAKKVLNAAALTYVAGLLVSILNLLRFALLIFIRIKDKD